MKTNKYLWVLVIFILILLYSCSSAVIFTCSEKDAQMYVDGKAMGTGTTDVIKVKRNNPVHVSAEKTGFFNQEIYYHFQSSNSASNPKNQLIVLVHDDAYDASIKNDYANKDFEQEVNKKLTEAEAWKVISEIVTSYFDNIEMADRETGYMKTSWQSKTFSKKTIRSRIIVKQSSFNPLKYKIKIVSEYADTPDQSVKDDDKFIEWDRILKKYSELITEFQTRLSGK